MGNFAVSVKSVGGHGCKRDVREGERVYGCRRVDCPDCLTAHFVELLARNGSGYALEATFTHWPGEKDEVIDTLKVNERGFVEVTRTKGDFGYAEMLQDPRNKK